jgi:hypothetical protein
MRGSCWTKQVQFRMKLPPFILLLGSEQHISDAAKRILS